MKKGLSNYESRQAVEKIPTAFSLVLFFAALLSAAVFLLPALVHALCETLWHFHFFRNLP
ncbi:hypothetical protein M769_0118925 [Bacillus haynesii]|nr:hypothetical protein M769_0118925 [Bacillus haynesii]